MKGWDAYYRGPYFECDLQYTHAKSSETTSSVVSKSTSDRLDARRPLPGVLNPSPFEMESERDESRARFCVGNDEPPNPTRFLGDEKSPPPMLARRSRPLTLARRPVIITTGVKTTTMTQHHTIGHTAAWHTVIPNTPHSLVQADSVKDVTAEKRNDSSCLPFV